MKNFFLFDYFMNKFYIEEMFILVKNKNCHLNKQKYKFMRNKSFNSLAPKLTINYFTIHFQNLFISPFIDYPMIGTKNTYISISNPSHIECLICNPNLFSIPN